MGLSIRGRSLFGVQEVNMGVGEFYVTRVLNELLRNTSFALPSAWWISLHTGAAGRTGTGNALASSPRFSITFYAAATNGTGGQASSSGAVSVVVSATGTITDIGIWDGSSTATANHIWNGALTASKTVANVGDTVQISAGQLVVKLE